MEGNVSTFLVNMFAKKGGWDLVCLILVRAYKSTCDWDWDCYKSLVYKLRLLQM